MTDRVELRRLAEACYRRTRYNEKAWQDWDDAASPDVVLGLLDQVDELTKQFDHAMVMSKRLMAERDQLRAALEAIAAHNPAVTHGWAEQVREMARRVLADPEVEKL